MQAITLSTLFVLLIISSSLAMDTMTSTITTSSPDSSLTTTTTTDDMVMMSDEATGTGSKSAQLNLPGFGPLDLSLFRFPGLTALSVPSLPNLTIPAFPSLPKIFTETPCLSLRSGRPGTCRKEDECIGSHGVPDGPCGLGLGVCCTKPFSCGEVIVQNESIIASPGFPEPSTKSEVCSFTILKSPAVSQVRLDLQVFDIAGADSSGICSEDVMEVTGANSDAVVPRICGMNQGQHLYIPVDKSLSPVVIKFLFSKSSSAHRLFKIRIALLQKDHPDLAPTGCVQYYNGKEGVVRSFNYEHVKDVGIRTIKGLKYGVCFKKSLVDKCKVKLNPTYTRVTRSAGHQVASPARYGYFPAQHPITNYQLQRSYGHVPVYRRPVYLNRPVLHQYKPQSYPVYHQQQPHARPVVYYPMPPVKSIYYYPTEKKVELVDKKKEELDGLLAKKKLLIEELSSLLKVPELAKLPSLPTLAPLPTLPSISLPTLPSLTAFSLPSLPVLPGVELPKSLQELLAKKIETVEELKKEIKKEDPYKQSGYGHPLPAHLYKQPVDLKESLFEKKEDLVNKLSGHKSLPSVHYDAYGRPIDLKETLIEKKTDLLEKKVDLINHLLPGHKSPAPYGPHYDPYNNKKTEVKEIVKEVIDTKKDLANELINSINNFNKNLLSPLPTFPSMISKDAYGLIVDNDHKELGRGFSIAYKEECEV